MRVAVIAHVYYPELWPELAACIRNVGACDLTVTYVDEASVVAARKDFPSARFLRCENRGYDVWPFLRALQDLRLDDFDCVVKLHTKRDVAGERPTLNHAWLGGSAWRRSLLAFVATPRNWRRTLRRLADPRVGLVADRHVVFRRGDLPPTLDGTFGRAQREFLRLTGRTVPEDASYVAGTMFAARPEALKPLLAVRFSSGMFESPRGHRCETYAHLVERMIGFSVRAAGLRIAAFNGSLRWRRTYYGRGLLGRLCRFVWQVRFMDGGTAVLKVLHVPVRRWTLPFAAESGRGRARPLISVLMPAYNHERYVENAIRSVMAQDWPSIELVVVDDGSKDGTWDVLERLKPECEARFVRTVMERQTNAGTRATLARLMDLARGELIAVLASDDAYLPGALSAMTAEMEKDERVGLVVGVNELMDGEGRRCYWDKDQNVVYDPAKAVDLDFNSQIARILGISGTDPRFGTYRELVRRNHVPNGQLIRRMFLDAVGPTPEEVPLEDHWLMIQLSKVCRMRMVDVPTFRYRWHGGNSISRCGKMEDFAERTLRFEERRIFAQRDLRCIRDCLEMRSCFGIPWLFAFRRYRTWFAKVWSLTAFGFEWFFRRESAGRVITGLGAWGK